MDIESLKRARTSIKGRLTRFRNQFEKRNNDKNFARELQSLITDCKNEFYNIQSQIELIEDVDYNSFETFESTYLDLMANINALLASTNIQLTHSINDNDIKAINVNLTKISLPTFDGSYENWLSFKDIYISLIHNNESLSNVEKFHYLKSALINGAASTIESIQVTNQYYAIAWQNLVDRFENKRFIVKKHTRALLKLNAANKTNLREFIDKLQTNYNALKAMNIPVESWDALLIEVINSKLDSKLIEDWESSSAESELPTYQELLQFLILKCKIVEAVTEGKFENPTKNNKFSQFKNKTYVAIQPEIKCLMCSEEHFIYQCKKFKSMSTNDRFEFIKSKNLCINCFKNDHRTNACKSRSCRTCHKKHNTLLHFENKKINTDETDQKDWTLRCNGCVCQCRSYVAHGSDIRKG